MKKLLLALLLLFLFSAGMLTPQQVLAACADPDNFTLEPRTTNFAAEETFFIRSKAEDCFATDIPYHFYFYPENLEQSVERAGNRIYKSEKSFIGTLIYFEVDFSRIPTQTSPMARYQNNTWIVLICTKNEPKNCVGDEQRVARLSFRMTPIPRPTPTLTPIPADLPRVQQPTQCIYRYGSAVDVTIENLTPGNQYVWWWRGESNRQARPFTPKATTYTLSLKRVDTNFPDEHKTLCVHKTAVPRGDSCKRGQQNSVTFKFTHFPPPGDTSCNALQPPPPEHNPVIPTGCSPEKIYTQCGSTCNDTSYEDNVTVSVARLSCSDEPTTRYDCKSFGERPGECGNGIRCPVCPETHPKYNPDTNSCCLREGGESDCNSPIDAPIVTCQSGVECGKGIGCGLGTRGPCGKKVLPDGTVTDDFTCDTAIGKFDVTPQAFVKRIFGLLLGISGGVALLLILYSSYRLMMSRGDPEKLQGARETLTSAIVGLLFIIFSLIILEIVGVDILKIPGLER